MRENVKRFAGAVSIDDTFMVLAISQNNYDIELMLTVNP